MELPFIKMHTAGRDVVLVDGTRMPQLGSSLSPDFCAEILDRHRGIGAQDFAILSRSTDDGLTITCGRPSPTAQGVCVNTILAASRFAIDSGIVSRTRFDVTCDASTIPVEALDSQAVLADLGPPRVAATGEELFERADTEYTRSTVVRQRSIVYTPVVLGGPHAVLFGTSLRPALARSLSHATVFPPPADDAPPLRLCFAVALQTTLLKVATWVAEVGEDSADGDSAAAGVVAGVLHGFVERDTMIHTRGGELYVSWANDNNRVYVTGTPDYVYTGTYSTD